MAADRFVAKPTGVGGDTRTPDKATLFEWLDNEIDHLPATGQIILNFDGNTVKWEVKAAYDGHDRNGDIERTEVRRFGRLAIPRLERLRIK